MSWAIGSKLGIDATKKLQGEPRMHSGLAAADSDEAIRGVESIAALLETGPVESLSQFRRLVRWSVHVPWLSLTNQPPDSDRVHLFVPVHELVLGHG